MFSIPLWYIISVPIKTFHLFGGTLKKLLCSLNYLILLVNRPSISGFLYLLQNCIRNFLNTIWLASHYCSNISPLILFQSFLYLNGRELTLFGWLTLFWHLAQSPYKARLSFIHEKQPIQVWQHHNFCLHE